MFGVCGYQTLGIFVSYSTFRKIIELIHNKLKYCVVGTILISFYGLFVIVQERTGPRGSIVMEVNKLMWSTFPKLTPVEVCISVNRVRVFEFLLTEGEMTIVGIKIVYHDDLLLPYHDLC